MSPRMEMAQECWGVLPDWVEALVNACDADGSSQNKVARRLKFSATVISQVLRNEYKGSLGNIERRVRAIYAPGTVQCPALGPISSEDCLPFNPNSAKTQFKKGGRAHNYRGAGHERIDAKDGYVVMIVDEPNPWTGAATRPVQKHRWLWEKVNGPVPEGMCLKSLDGDKTNTDPSNWEAIPRALLPRLNGRFGRGYDAASAELKPTILATAKLEHAVRTRRRGEE